jgi:hypothetical protein
VLALCIMRQFRPHRLSSGVLAVCIAYALAIQALTASIGLGMSAFALPGRTGLVICSLTTLTQAPDRDRQKPGPAPQCPFCFVAAQSAGHIAVAGEATALPAYAVLSVASILDPVRDAIFVSHLDRTTGQPRAPPILSV